MRAAGPRPSRVVSSGPGPAGSCRGSPGQGLARARRTQERNKGSRPRRPNPPCSASRARTRPGGPGLRRLGALGAGALQDLLRKPTLAQGKHRLDRLRRWFLRSLGLAWNRRVRLRTRVRSTPSHIFRSVRVTLSLPLPVPHWSPRPGPHLPGLARGVEALLLLLGPGMLETARTAPWAGAVGSLCECKAHPASRTKPLCRRNTSRNSGGNGAVQLAAYEDPSCSSRPAVPQEWQCLGGAVWDGQDALTQTFTRAVVRLVFLPQTGQAR